MVFTSSLLGTQHLGEVVENKQASLLVMSLGKALNGMPPPLRGRQVAQFSLLREGWRQKEHLIVKTKNAMLNKYKLSAVATPNQEKAKRRID